MEIEKTLFKTNLLEAFSGDLNKMGNPLEYLVATTSSCLLNECRYYENDDQRRNVLLGALEIVSEKEPEFILQLAVYLRRDLGIRTTTNFILAYAACSDQLRQYLTKYFQKATVLPTDLVEICQFVQIIHLLQKGKTMNEIRNDNEKDLFEVRNKIFMPNQLKKALTEKIMGFKEYELGKYCSEGRRKAILDKYLSARKGKLSRKLLRQKARNEKLKKKAEEEKKNVKEVEEKNKAQSKLAAKMINRKKMIKKHKQKVLSTGEILKKKAIELTFLTMKDIIELAHVKPTLLTSAIVGSKYPKTLEDFQKKFKHEGFDATLAGKRMHLKIPVTWETELSTKGNTKAVWSELITNNKVPYLATLRNLRNIIKAGVENNLISKLAAYISSPHAI